MARICVIGDGIQTPGSLKLVLMRAGDDGREFNLGEHTPEVLQQTASHVVLLDLNLEGMSEAQLIRAMRLSRVRVPCAVDQAHRDAQNSPAIERWARIVVRGSMLTMDPRTVGKWAREIGMSYGAVRNWCHSACIPAKVSLQFTRLLRAVIWSTKSERPPHDFLDVVDSRTLSRLLRRGGLNSLDGQTARLISVERFLSTQDLVVDAGAVALVRCLLNAETLEIGQ